MEIILLLGDNFEGKDIPNLAYLLILPSLPKGTIMNKFVWKDQDGMTQFNPFEFGLPFNPSKLFNHQRKGTIMNKIVSSLFTFLFYTPKQEKRSPSFLLCSSLPLASPLLPFPLKLPILMFVLDFLVLCHDPDVGLIVCPLK